MITERTEITERLSNKHILLDNDVITRASDHPSEFRTFLTLLQDSNCQPLITPLIKFEYIRGAHQVTHKQKREAFIDALNIGTMPSLKDLGMEIAIKIAHCYAARKLETPSIVDCSLAAYLLQYKNNLFLATLNHKDYPTFLLDRVAVVTVDTEKDVYPIGIYGYNTEKAKSMSLDI